MTSPASVRPLPEASPPPPVREAPEERLWTWSFVQVLAVQVSFGFAFSSFFLLPKYLQQELAATPRQIGAVTGIGLGVAVAGVPLLGWAIDRYRRDRLLMIGTLLAAVSSYAYTWVTQVGGLLYTLRALQGLAFVTTFNTAATLAVELSPPSRLSQSLGYFGLAMLCTNAIAPAIIEPLVAQAGWNVGFLLAATSASVATLVALGLPSTTPTSESPRAARLLLSRRALGIFYTTVLVGLGFGTLVTFAQPFALSLGASEVRQLFIGYTLAALAVRIGLGSLADRVGRHRVALGSLALYGLVLLATTQLKADWLFYVGLGLGVAHGLLYPALNALLVESAPTGSRGLVMTSFNGAFNLGFAVSVLAFGVVAETAGFSSLFLIAGLLTLSGVVTLALIPGSGASPPLTPPPPESATKGKLHQHSRH